MSIFCVLPAFDDFFEGEETRSEARAAVKTDDEGAAAPVVRDFLSSPTAEEEEARAAFERAKEQLEQERGRFAEERATWEAGRVEAEEAFKDAHLQVRGACSLVCSLVCSVCSFVCSVCSFVCCCLLCWVDWVLGAGC